MRGSPRLQSKPGTGTGSASAEEEADLARAAAVASTASTGLRKKGVWVRTWLLLDCTGQAQLIEAGKHTIMRRTGLPARDLRILDPLLSYPSTVLGREKAIVINLEHIKAIITAQEVLLLNSRDPSVAPFVEELQRRISHLHHANRSQDGRRSDDTNDSGEVGSRRSSPIRGDPEEFEVCPLNYSRGFSQFQATDEGDKIDGKNGVDRKDDGPRVLPFEFVALEACLEAACSCLDTEVREIIWDFN